ncbi:MAG TPA: hypothetical protein VKE40_02825 [Gemmataceae bacterium]|nr:hypothetical protein [Gemmataceae bacterium]
MRRNVISRYFNALAVGDPIALGVTAVFVLFLVVVGFIAWRAKRDEKRYEEQKRKKWGLKAPTDKK